MVPELTKSKNTYGEERLGGFCLKGCAKLYLNRHEFPICCNIEKLMAVTPPLWLCSTHRGNSYRTTRCRECLNINLRPSGYVGAVGHPFSVWRELRLLFIKITL